jgi:uncharacterized RDD family membrane protein YckC
MRIEWHRDKRDCEAADARARDAEAPRAGDPTAATAAAPPSDGPTSIAGEAAEHVDPGSATADAPDFPLPDDHRRPAPPRVVATEDVPRGVVATEDARHGAVAMEGVRHYAGFLRRAAAFVIDAVVLGAFTLPLVLAGFAGVKLALVTLGLPAPLDTMDALESLASIGWFAMAMVYFTALHAGDGQTIGKALVGIRVRTMTDLAPLGVLRSALRAVGYAASSSFFGFGFLLVALTPSKRGWHDYLAGTCVVRLARDEA